MALEIESLVVKYNGDRILDTFSLTVREGEIVAVVGPNGAGKTTLIRAVSGVAAIASGRVAVDGVDLTTLNESTRARKMAVVPQARALPGSFSVYHTVLLGRTPYLGWLGRTSPADRARVAEALQQTRTDPFSNRLVGTLSGGEQQRVILARALVQDAPVLLLDEPTTNLDLRHRAAFLDLVRRLAKEKALVVLVVLHDLHLAGIYADRVALVKEGQLVASGAPAEVLTPENVSTVFEVDAAVVPHPEDGVPLIFPYKKA